MTENQAVAKIFVSEYDHCHADLKFNSNFSFLLPSSSAYKSFLSGDTWHFYCDWALSEEEGFDPALVKCGDTVFVEHHSLKMFRRKYLPKIRHS